MSHFMFTKTWTPPRLKSSIKKNNNNKTVLRLNRSIRPRGLLPELLHRSFFFSFSKIISFFYSLLSYFLRLLPSTVPRCLAVFLKQFYSTYIFIYVFISNWSFYRSFSSGSSGARAGAHGSTKTKEERKEEEGKKKGFDPSPTVYRERVAQ